MELKKYDEKLVRIKTNYNEEFEGYCIYNDRRKEKNSRIKYRL